MRVEPPDQPSPPGAPAPAPSPRAARMARQARVVIGVGGVVALLAEYGAAQSDARAAVDAEASAIQIVQVWTPHLYYALVIVGVMIALYLVTRYAD